MTSGRKPKNRERVLGVTMGLSGFGIALLAGWVALPALLYETLEQPLEFSHAKHVGDDVGMSCEDCHAFRGDGSFVGVPPTSACGDCHSDPMGETAVEKRLVEEYVKPGREIPWLVYSRQPDNAYFSHAPHVRTAKIACEHCHGKHGETEELRSYQRNRLTGQSRDIWGAAISGVKSRSWDRMKMDDCIECHEARGKESSCMMCHK